LSRNNISTIKCFGVVLIAVADISTIEVSFGQAIAENASSCGEPNRGQKRHLDCCESYRDFAAGIRQGIAELKDPATLVPGRIRKEGGGRKRASDKDSFLKADLESLLESTTRGDPQADAPLEPARACVS